MLPINPLQIHGEWREGFALDYHTVDYKFNGYNFVPIYTEIGKELHNLKYEYGIRIFKPVEERIDLILEIAKTVKEFIRKKWKLNFDMMIPVPPSRERALNPVMILTEALRNRFTIPVCDNTVKRIKDIPELKNEKDPDRKKELLKGVHSLDVDLVKGKKILLFDDIYDSGATLNSLTNLLYNDGKVSDVFVLAITRTRR